MAPRSQLSNGTRSSALDGLPDEAVEKGETGAEYDELLDTIAAVCGAGDSHAFADLHSGDELRVPPEVIRRSADPLMR